MTTEPEKFDKAMAQWEPSPETPLAPVRCVVVGTDGTRCDSAAMEGANRCLRHGAEEVEADKVVKAARRRLQGMANTALETFEDVMKNSINDSARIKAASEVLNRVGVKEDTNIKVEIEDKSSARAAIFERLETMRVEDLQEAEIIEEE